MDSKRLMQNFCDFHGVLVEKCEVMDIYYIPCCEDNLNYLEALLQKEIKDDLKYFYNDFCNVYIYDDHYIVKIKTLPQVKPECKPELKDFEWVRYY